MPGRKLRPVSPLEKALETLAWIADTLDGRPQGTLTSDVARVARCTVTEIREDITSHPPRT